MVPPPAAAVENAEYIVKADDDADVEDANDEALRTLFKLGAKLWTLVRFLGAVVVISVAVVVGDGDVGVRGGASKSNGLLLLSIREAGDTGEQGDEGDEEEIDDAEDEERMLPTLTLV